MTPEFERFQEKFASAIPQGLVAAVAIYHGAIREKLQRGYTSGDFVTGNVASSVQVSPPAIGNNEWEVVIGTNEMYALYWEMGHVNLFTGKFERVEHWQDALDEQGAAMAEAFGSTVHLILDGG